MFGNGAEWVPPRRVLTVITQGALTFVPNGDHIPAVGSTYFRPSWLVAPAVAGSLCLVSVALGWRGSDLPAQLFRADLVRVHGFVLWNNLWYGGHGTLDYGLLTPALGALAGPLLLAAVSCVFGTYLFGLLLRRTWPSYWQFGTLAFAGASAVNVIVGRVPFALGLTLGLAALVLLDGDRFALAAMAGLAAAAASPVAGAFVMLAAVAWGVAHRPQRIGSAIVAVVTATPIGLATVLYPSAGFFPLRGAAVAWDVGVCACVYVLARLDGRRTLAIASGLYAVACLGAFVVSSPLGGNVSRLGQFVAAPVVLSILIGRRKLAAVVLAAPLLIWQWAPGVDAAVASGNDPSTQRAYYQPLLDFLAAHPGPVSRVEVPLTFRHWETTYVADTVPLARGWERQIDLGLNPAFYDDTLDPTVYHDWLVDNAVRFVALPDARLDRSSFRERDLLQQGLAGLTEVANSGHWRIWQVNDDKGLVDGPGIVSTLDASSVVVDVAHAGDLLVRVRYSARWHLDGPGCTQRSPGGWTELHDVQPGQLLMSQALHGSVCPAPPTP